MLLSTVDASALYPRISIPVNMSSYAKFDAYRSHILANIQDDEWRFYIGDMLKSAPLVAALVLGKSTDKRRMKAFTDLPDLQILAKFCLGSTDFSWSDALHRLLGALNFSVSRETTLAMVPGDHWPKWIADGLLRVQDHLRQTEPSLCTVDAAPGNVPDVALGGWIQMDNLAINFFWHRMFQTRTDCLIEDGVKSLAQQGFRRRDVALRTLAQGVPHEFQMRYADACERGLFCQALREACGATNPSSREAIWIRNAQLMTV
jgi:hypothetical protein